MRLSSPVPGALALIAIVFGAACLLGCDRAAELIPGSASATPTTVDGLPVSSATPIVVQPGGGGGGGTGGGEALSDAELARAVVQVVAVSQSGGAEEVVRSGSGVVVDAEQRLIATAYPLVRPDTVGGLLAYGTLFIGTTAQASAPAERAYVARLVRSDPATGLALLQVTGDVEGNETAFDLPQVAFGDASAVSAGFGLRLFGYPGIAPGQPGDAAVATAAGVITGLRGVTGSAGRAWFKTDARLPSGAAGGAAFDRSGALVGILAQPRYVPGGEVGQVRPVDLLTTLLEEQAEGQPDAPAPVYRGLTMPGTLSLEPASGIYVSHPAFAENAVESVAGRDLFDYETRFAEGLAQLYYEYDLTGAPDGATIEEQWYLDGLLQDSLSSSFIWDQGGFGIVNDRITSPGAGIPTGRWRLDVLVGGVLHATATAVVGVDLLQPAATWFGGGGSATPDGQIAEGAFSGGSQIVGFFDVDGMESVRRVQWVVFHAGAPVYTSPEVPWRFGNTGRFWVGYRPPDTLAAGVWDFELRADGELVASGTANIP